MKKYLIPIIALVFFTVSSTSAEKNVEKEKEAIKTVIKDQTIASSNRDFDLLSSYWGQDESVVRIASGKNGFNKGLGWEEISKGYKAGIKNNPEPFKMKKKYSDFKIKVYKECAWAVFNESAYNDEGELLGVQVGTRFLEKKDGDWKIVYMAFVNTSSYKEVDAEAAK
jgi:hypothetical protein